jgi:outer membrane protein assembly factor BamB
VGAPAVSQSGVVYQVDKDGNLSAFDQQGKLLWRFQPQNGLKGMDGPSVGPDGSIYYVVGNYAKGNIQAVSPEGKSIWLVPVKTNRFFLTPQVIPGGEFVFFRNEVFDARDGSAIDFTLPFEVDEYIVGQDARTYLRAKGTIVEWTYDGSAVALKEERVLADDPRPVSAGVTSQGVVWLLYSDRVVWFARDGEALGAAQSDIWARLLVGVDRDFSVYTCGHGAGYGSNPSCVRLSPDSPDPIWRVRLTARAENLLGGALTPGRVYFALEGGELFVIEEES